MDSRTSSAALHNQHLSSHLDAPRDRVVTRKFLHLVEEDKECGVLADDSHSAGVNVRLRGLGGEVSFWEWTAHRTVATS